MQHTGYVCIRKCIGKYVRVVVLVMSHLVDDATGSFNLSFP